MTELLPLKYIKIWSLCQPFFKQGRPGDKKHAEEIIDFILNYKGELRLDKDILIPVAMMHDIGHAAILSEHFTYITGFDRLINGKLVHMLAGAKIAKGILEKAKYNKNKIKEIVEIISMHDMDQLQDTDIKKVYDTKNKKIFHDFDSLDRYNEKRIDNFLKKSKGIKKEKHIKIFGMLEDYLSLYFYSSIKKIAATRLEKLKIKYT